MRIARDHKSDDYDYDVDGEDNKEQQTLFAWDGVMKGARTWQVRNFLPDSKHFLSV
jgi:hypothetical protein